MVKNGKEVDFVHMVQNQRLECGKIHQEKDEKSIAIFGDLVYNMGA